jgi:hypothetical protein
MNARARLSIIAGIICSGLVVASVAWAAASTQITLAKGLDNPHGQILSSRKSCLGNRKVIAFMQLGATQNPQTDKKVDKTTSTRDGNIGTWDMGNPGFPKHKKYYVEATRTSQCAAGFSKSQKFK